MDVPTTAEPHTSLSSSSTGVSSGDPKADPTATGDGGGGPKGARRRSRDRLRGVDPRHPYYGAGGADAPLILFPMCFWYLGYTEAAPEAWSSMGGDPAHMWVWVWVRAAGVGCGAKMYCFLPVLGGDKGLGWHGQ